MDCPPLGQQRIRLATDAFSFDVDQKPVDNDRVEFTFNPFLDMEKAQQTVEKLCEINPRWDDLWPTLYAKLIGMRADYGRSTDLPPDGCEMELCPPDDDDPSEWHLALELEDGDGCWMMSFDLDGNIGDSQPMF